jgi:hypothetical protein
MKTTTNEVPTPVATATSDATDEMITDVYEPSHGSDGTMGLMAGTGMGAIAGGIVGGVLAGPGGALLGVAAGSALGAAGGEAAAHIGTDLEEEFNSDGPLGETHHAASGDETTAAISPINSALGPVAPGAFTGLPMSADIYGVSGGMLGMVPPQSTLAPSDVASDDEIARETQAEAASAPTQSESEDLEEPRKP